MKIFRYVSITAAILALLLVGCAPALTGAAIWREFDYGKMDGLIAQRPLPPEAEVPEEDPSEPQPPETPDPPDNRPPTVPEPEPQPQYVLYIRGTTDGINIRSGAGTGFQSVGKLDADDMVVYRGESGDWYRTVYKEKTAYVSKKFADVTKLEKSESAAVERVLEEGYKLLGYPYVWGAQRYHWGNGVRNSAFRAGQYDCSSLTQYIFYIGAGVTMDTTTRTQVSQGRAAATPKRGDLLFFTNDSRYQNSGLERVGHVAVYLGNNYILHTSSDYAVIEPMSAKRHSYFIAARRFL